MHNLIFKQNKSNSGQALYRLYLEIQWYITNARIQDLE
jgi:hypothetical protein